MANRYIRMGATYNGDGTTADPATEDGGEGAWNHATATTSGSGNWTAIPYFEGTAVTAPATLPAGTTVYIKSKDEAGFNITVALIASKTLGSASATEALPIHWIIDNGTIWSGVSGVVTYSCATTFYCSLLVNNKFESLDYEALVFRNTKVDLANTQMVCSNSGYVVNALFDQSTKTSGDGVMSSMGSRAIYEKCHFKFSHLSSNVAFPSFTLVNLTIQYIRFLYCDFELTHPTSVAGYGLFVNNGSYSGQISFIGGVIRGEGSLIGNCLTRGGVGAHNQILNFIGTRIPPMPQMYVCSLGTPTFPFEVNITGADDGTTGIGGHIENYMGFATSRTDNNPPTRYAFLPDSSNTPWAWRLWLPRASMTRPWIQTFLKTYTGDAETLNITLEILASTESSPLQNTCWIVLSYIDSTTGDIKTVSSQGLATALATSSAVWSSTTWSTISCNKNSMTVVTPTAVKKDSILNLNLYMTCGNVNVNAQYFIDPDFTVA